MFGNSLLSNYRPEDAPFLDELKIFPNISYHPIFTMTETDRLVCVWDVDRGFICDEMLRKYLPDVKAPIYYLVGTLSFTKAMETLLVDMVLERRISNRILVGL